MMRGDDDGGVLNRNIHKNLKALITHMIKKIIICKNQFLLPV